MPSYFSPPGNRPLSPSPSLSPHLLPLQGSHCSSAGHRCIRRASGNKLNQEDSSTASYSPCWDLEKLVKGGRGATWIHFPCDRVGCSLRTQHRQRLLGFFFSTLKSLAGDGAKRNHPSSPTRVSAVQAAAASASPLGPPPSRRMGWAQKQPGTCSRHLLWLLPSCPLPHGPSPAAVEAARPGSCWLSW